MKEVDDLSQQIYGAEGLFFEATLDRMYTEESGKPLKFKKSWNINTSFNELTNNLRDNREEYSSGSVIIEQEIGRYMIECTQKLNDVYSMLQEDEYQGAILSREVKSYTNMIQKYIESKEKLRIENEEDEK